jgi:hypothetical protein
MENDPHGQQVLLNNLHHKSTVQVGILAYLIALLLLGAPKANSILAIFNSNCQLGLVNNIEKEL